MIIKLHVSNATNLYWQCSDPLLQISASTITIKDEARKQIYLQILSDQFCMGIISSIIEQPKTAVEIAKQKMNLAVDSKIKNLESNDKDK